MAAGAVIKFGQKLLKMKVDFEDIPNRLDAIAEKLPTVSMEGLQYRKKWPSAPDCACCSYVQEKNENADSEKDSVAGTG